MERALYSVFVRLVVYVVLNQGLLGITSVSLCLSTQDSLLVFICNPNKLGVLCLITTRACRFFVSFTYLNKSYEDQSM